MEINPSDTETTIVVFEDDGLECNGNIMNQIEFTTDKGSNKSAPDATNGTFLIPETFMAQNSVLGQDFVINCTPCSKIFVSADGYNRHIQNKECADETNTALLAEVPQENIPKVYTDEQQVVHEDISERCHDRESGWEADTKEENTSINNDRSQQSKTNPTIEATQQKDSSLETSEEDKLATDHLSDNASQITPEMDTPNSNESSNVEQMDVSESVNKDVSNIDNPEQTQETQSLEKMTRKVYECSSCKERFTNTDNLNVHSKLHFTDDRTQLLQHSLKQNSQEDFIDNSNVALRDKFPNVFERILKVVLEKVDINDYKKQEMLNNGSKKYIKAGDSTNSAESVNQKRVYCICRKSKRRGMIGCDFCEEWFHPDCLSLSIDEANALTEVTWKCPVCEGTAIIDYQNEKNTMHSEINKDNIPSKEMLNEEKSTNNKTNEPSKRLKVNVGPGEWLWLVGDQLVAPTKEELLKERDHSTKRALFT